jgi:DNA-binding MarR family transcriptional regulator
MEARELVRRDRAPSGGVNAAILPRGRKALAAARPVHAAAVRRHVLARIDRDDAEALVRIVRRMETA